MVNFDVDDVMQDIKLHILLNIDKMPEDREHAVNWMVAVARNCIRDRFRSNSATLRPTSPLDPGVDCPTSDSSPSSVAVMESQIVRIKQAIDELPDSEKEIIDCYFFSQEPLKIIARRLGYSFEHVSRLKKKAIEFILRRIGGQ